MSDQLNPSEFELIIDNDCRRHLHDTSKWGKFLAISGLIFSVFLLVIGIAVSMKEPANEGFFIDEESRAARRIGSLVGSLFLGFIYIFPSIMLLRYSTKLKSALAVNNQEDLTNAFRAQKTMYVYIGILTILMLVFMLIATIGVLSEPM
jgi:amino acid transporter